MPPSVAAMELFVRESGPAGAATIVFLHGAEHSGRSWQSVLKHLPWYHRLVPDLPQHGESLQGGPFDIDRAAAAVADVIRSRASTGPVHLVGHSLGAQVGAQLLATEPGLIDRAVLCGAVINTLPGIWLTRLLLGAVAGISRSFEISHSNQERAHPVGVPTAGADDDPHGVRRMPAEQLSEIVVASAGFTLPEGLDKSSSTALFLTGAMEMPLVHRSATALSRRIPDGVDGVARGMGHDWPLRYPGIFARTVDSWISGTALPSQIALSEPVGNRTELRQAG
jgi:pimeloyl-ACP methyl ester carboxylesterase